MKTLFQLAICLVSLPFLLVGQYSHIIMTYNLLGYPGTDYTTRNPFFRTIITAVQPDILVVQEMTSQAGVVEFFASVVNPAGTGYSAGAFNDGYDTDNAVFYKNSYFEFLGNYRITTALRDINQFVFRHKMSGDTIRIFSAHLKASTGTTNEAARAAEVDNLRAVTKTFHSGANFIVVGDFNIYASTEPAFQKLLSTSTSGYFIDPLNLIGTWNSNSSFAYFHTQSPRIRSFGGGSTGGLDDRFDMILISQAVKDTGGVEYVPGSYTTYGNDGQHFNDSINRPTNLVVSQQIADALHYASDHLPVYARFTFKSQPTRVKSIQQSKSKRVSFSSPFPNPFNGETSLRFNLPNNCRVHAELVNTLGQPVATVADDFYEAGDHSLRITDLTIPSGMYFLRFLVGETGYQTKLLHIR